MYTQVRILQSLVRIWIIDSEMLEPPVTKPNEVSDLGEKIADKESMARVYVILWVSIRDVGSYQTEPSMAICLEVRELRCF